MKVKKTLILTGFMGSGKSTVGRKLARRLRIPFHDLDHVIERAENTTIPQIFSEKGEMYFRELEYRHLSKIMDGPPVVLSLGGGALQQGRTFEIAHRNSLLIYLKVPAAVLLQRLKNDLNRPLLRGENGRILEEPELLRRIEAMLEERENSYSRAHVTVHVHPQWNSTKTTNEVIRVLTAYAPATHIEHH